MVTFVRTFPTSLNPLGSDFDIFYSYVLEDDLTLPPSKYSSIQSNTSETVNSVKAEHEADGKYVTRLILDPTCNTWTDNCSKLLMYKITNTNGQWNRFKFNHF